WRSGNCGNWKGIFDGDTIKIKPAEYIFEYRTQVLALSFKYYLAPKSILRYGRSLRSRFHQQILRKTQGHQRSEPKDSAGQYFRSLGPQRRRQNKFYPDYQ